MKKRIAIFASGSGTNAEKFFEYFKNCEHAEIALLASNKETAFALQRAKNHHVKTFTFTRHELQSTSAVLDVLKAEKIDYVVLAGFLLLIPQNLIQAFPNKIINIHPALLPKYGGKGMYGMKVHEAVKEAGEKQSGITIHLVNEKYDEGKILSQHTVSLEEKDEPEGIAQKIHQLEYEYFPRVVDQYIQM